MSYEPSDIAMEMELLQLKHAHEEWFAEEIELAKLCAQHVVIFSYHIWLNPDLIADKIIDKLVLLLLVIINYYNYYYYYSGVYTVYETQHAYIKCVFIYIHLLMIRCYAFPFPYV